MNTSVQQPPFVTLPRAYVHWLIFVQTLIALVFQFTTILLMSRVVFCRFMRAEKFQTRNISKTVIIYMVVHIIGSTCTFPYHFYLVLFWRPAVPSFPGDEPLYNPYILFWTGIFMSVYVYAPGVPIFFLTLDRCMALKFPVQYHNNSKWIRGRLPAVTTVLTVLWCVAYLTTIVVSVPPDMTQATYCQTLTCVVSKRSGTVMQYLKNIMTALNVLCTLYFFYVFSKFRSSIGDSKFVMKNRVALVTIVSDILLNVVPTVFAIVFLNVTGVSPGNIIGNNVILMFTLDAAICSLFYNRTYMRKAFKNGKICFMHSSGNANT